ncbi:RNase adapter RapZ [Candidatus Cyanaurora vandensis]|uniref:RNase adapter RapZ n=1 Tax=Candidatus Cyanaurora vandensis TaxID=2714958 RepID=UPI00257A14F8|nr:RNase adapter RapZ [Candidatus Cyanaurora vandensis]
MLQPQTLVLIGLSGSGRSTVLNILEDLGYFVMDNFLPALVPAFLQLPRPQPLLALEMAPSVGEAPTFVAKVEQALGQLKDAGHEPRLIFIECDTPALLARYALTRRPHPLMTAAADLAAAIEQERAHLAPLRPWAWAVLDTSQVSVKHLRTEVESLVAGRVPPMTVVLTSFGYKYGVPPEANLLFDIRFLANPYYEPRLRELTGMNTEVVDYVFGFREAQLTYGRVHETIAFFLSQYRQERRGQVSVAVGCTGGQHRSVAFVERLAQHLTPDPEQWRIRVTHREQDMRSRHGQP